MSANWLNDVDVDYISSAQKQMVAIKTSVAEDLKRYLEKLAEVVEGEISLVLGAKKELRRLQRRLLRLQDFLESADQLGSTDSQIGAWARELKDVMYDADDIIDSWMIEGAQLLQAPSSTSRVGCLPTLPTSCIRCIKYYHKMGTEIKDINDRLKEIEEDRETISKLEYQLGCSLDDITTSPGTSHVEVRSDIVGTQIEDAAKYLINAIVADNTQNDTLYAITGMGGIGKTTLARRIFNDDRIHESFAKQVWLHISRNYSENELLKVMIRSLGGSIKGEEVKSELEPKLKSLLPDKLFLVLDDIWNGNVWADLLRPPIMSKAICCRILVTTRDETITRNINARVQYCVNEMDNQSCWELLCKEVFRSEGEEVDKLKEIGFKIIEKCRGLPLAIKAIAGVLRSKERSKIQWENVLASDIWSMREIDDKLPRALYLSYVNLQSHLKQCFLYCCLYPENNRICDRRMISRLWVAEGFIGVQGGDKLMEDKAKDYYEELIWRNLLLPDPVDKNLFIMHDLYRSLAQVLMNGESISICDDQVVNASLLTKLRRLSMTNIDEKVLSNGTSDKKCLRALFLFNSPKIKIIDNDLLKKLDRLRVLLLNGIEIDGLPRSIGHLLHLRYLDLDRTNIRDLPESIGCLVNLQTLSVCDCSFLQSLPRTINRLLNLRCLRVSRTPLTHLPKGINNLRNLNHLGGFIIGHETNTSDNNEGCDLEELQSLTNLRHLSIHRLEKAVTAASVLQNKHFLTELALWGRKSKDDSHKEVLIEEEVQRAERIYNELSPCSSLLDLEIEQFPARQLPSWMMSSSLGDNFPKLEILRLRHSSLCTKLPPGLSQLPELKYLDIIGMNAVTTIGPGFLSCISTTSTAFPKLEHLQFMMMKNWKEWTSNSLDGLAATRLKLLPRLKKLDIIDCPNLQALPEDLSYATNLKELHIEQCHGLREIKNFPFLTNKLKVIKNQGLKQISDLPMLHKLEIDSCPNLTYVENLNGMQHLMLVFDFKQASQLPLWLQPLASQDSKVAHQNFRKLEIQCDLGLLQSCLKGGIYWNLVQVIPEVRIRTIEGSVYLNYTKNPHKYETNAKETISKENLFNF